MDNPVHDSAAGEAASARLEAAGEATTALSPIDALLLGQHDGLAVTWLATAELKSGDDGHVVVPWALAFVLAGELLAPGALTAHVVERQAALHGVRVRDLVDQGHALDITLCVGADPRPQTETVKRIFDREVAAGLEHIETIERALAATPAAPICPACTPAPGGGWICLGRADPSCGQHALEPPHLIDAGDPDAAAILGAGSAGAGAAEAADQHG